MIFDPARCSAPIRRRARFAFLLFDSTSRRKQRLALLATFALMPSLYAQSGTLRGRVTDQSGAIVPNAQVTIIGLNGDQKNGSTDAKGNYSLTRLTPATYFVSGSAPNLETAEPVRIDLHAGTQELDLQLKVATVKEQTTVEGQESSGLSTESANNSNALVLRGSELDALSDNPDDLQTDLQALAGPSAGPSGAALFIDGFSVGELPAKESIREIRINQNPFSPEYDKLGYARIEIFTKPGTDQYHAQIDYNLGSDVWNSRNPYSTVKAPFLLNEFEGNGSGPIGKRASFTLDAQRNMVDNGFIVNGEMLTSALSVTPYNATVNVHQRLWRVSPRIDYRLNDNNTLTFRYGVTQGNIPDSGIGGFSLESQGYHLQYTNQTVQVGETAVLGNAVNETRLEYYRTANQTIANSSGPEVQVLSSFTGGGAQVGRSFDTQNNFELENSTSKLAGAHTFHFGLRLRGQTEDSISRVNFNGTFTFGGGLAPVLNAANQPVLGAAGQIVMTKISSIERYRRTLLFQELGDSPSLIRSLGGGATQFSTDAGLPALSVHQFDAGVFLDDEWRFRPNLTLNLGIRYEMQSNIHDWHNAAPRLAIAWAPSRSGGGKTVIRAGAGIFYDRFALVNTLTARRYNGVVQQQYVLTNPDFFPNLPPPASLSALSSSQAIQVVSTSLRAPYVIQSAIAVERQLPKKTTIALTYTNSHGLHELMSNDINAPLPGSFVPGNPSSGVFPLGRTGPVFLMESAGLYNQNQLMTNVRSNAAARVSFFGFYVFSKADSNTDGIGTFPANPYNIHGEYGPAATDIRHRGTFGGSFDFGWHTRISPFVILQSGAPFDITTGSDLYGTTLFNARPGLASDPAKPGLVETPYGILDPTPAANEPLLGRNAGRGPAQITLNLRISKTIGLGSPKQSTKGSPANGGTRGGKAEGAEAAAGKGLRSEIGASSTERRYNLNIGLSARNLLNHTNPGPIIGDITSPLFGQSNQTASTPNGEGFYENANNRRIELQIRFGF